MNKYEQDLLQNSSRLDAVVNGNGKITNCAKEITENNKAATKILCKLIEKTSQLKDPKITSIAIATKDSLIRYYGHEQLVNLCTADEGKEENYTLEELMTQLNQLIGLESVKSQVNDLISFQTVQLLRKAKGLHTPKRTMHLAFTGNPGTGKTTVARIVGRIYRKLKSEAKRS